MEKERLSIVIVGHVDHGKSTLIGRLLYDTNSVSEDRVLELKKASQITESKLEFAFLLDHLKEEREQGISIDTTQTFFKSNNREFRIIDAPGHTEFTKNMITGATQADIAILIVDVSEGIKEQTRRHAFILSLIGISSIIVVINKMDKVGYSECAYNQVVGETKEILNKLNMSASHFIPIVALEGENVCTKSKRMGWYTESTLLETMHTIEKSPDIIEMPAIFPIQDVYKINNQRIAVGRLETGIIHKNDILKVIQTGNYTRIASIEKYLEKKESSVAGECVGIITENPVYLERGYILCQPEVEIIMSDKFEVSMIWLDYEPIKIGQKVQIRCGNQEISCIIDEITKKINTEELTEEIMQSDQMYYLDAGRVYLSAKRKLAISKFKHNKCTGRFVILRNDVICAGGIIL